MIDIVDIFVENIEIKIYKKKRIRFSKKNESPHEKWSNYCNKSRFHEE